MWKGITCQDRLKTKVHTKGALDACAQGVVDSEMDDSDALGRSWTGTLDPGLLRYERFPNTATAGASNHTPWS
jgi:hypothetical protein